MSEEWNKRNHCNTNNLWVWIQEQARRIENQLIDSQHYDAQGISAMLLGRREMLTCLCDWLKANEIKIEQEK